MIQAVKAASAIALEAPPNPVPYGQPLTLTSIVVAPPGASTPTGSVVFLVDGVEQAPVLIQVVSGMAEASLSYTGLLAGRRS
jgi:hypothetical protein